MLSLRDAPNQKMVPARKTPNTWVASKQFRKIPEPSHYRPHYAVFTAHTPQNIRKRNSNDGYQTTAARDIADLATGLELKVTGPQGQGHL